MPARLLEGKPLAVKIKEEIKKEVQDYKARHNSVPILASVAVGDNAASSVYVKAQESTAKELGIEYQFNNLPQETTQDDLIKFIEKLNNDGKVNGIIIQLPLPSHIDKAISVYITPCKDVEGMHPANLGRIVLGTAHILPCTPLAVMKLLEQTGVDLYGKQVVVVGHSEIVGKPVSLLLLNKFATVSICHIGTSQAGKLEDYVKDAEILIVAVGRAGLIKKDWVRPGAIVIDVGINRVNGKIVGDVEPQASELASFITPVPGGVGPLTVTMLMKNTIEALGLQRKNGNQRK